MERSGKFLVCLLFRVLFDDKLDKVWTVLWVKFKRFVIWRTSKKFWELDEIIFVHGSLQSLG